ncbi:L-lactate oxidase [Salmonella enterica subsp. enterica serovar Choleraesuis]|nr:L-lactate oxidase [Salmonella enterica subsp. enterica serovar Choleraesuis]
MNYIASNEEKAIDIVNLASLEQAVRPRMEKGAFGYIRGGSEDEFTLKQNTLSFNRKKIVPRVLQGISQPSLATEVLGIKLSTPIIQAPVAAQGLAHTRGEMASAQGMYAAGSIAAVSTYASTTIADTRAAAPNVPMFFQLYMSKDEGFNKFILDEAVKAGVKAIILTADSTQGGYREEDVVNNFQFPLPMQNLAAYSSKTASGDGAGKGIAEIYAAAKQALEPADIAWIKAYTHLPVIVKGVQCAEDAATAISAGADGIWVSNHGGRQLDGAPGSFEVLSDIAVAVAKRVPLFFDSGVRRGEHVFKALACGADAVALGRPIVYGLNLGGAQGVTSVIEHLNKELLITMQLAGTRTISEVKNTRLID